MSYDWKSTRTHRIVALGLMAVGAFLAGLDERGECIPAAVAAVVLAAAIAWPRRGGGSSS